MKKLSLSIFFVVFLFSFSLNASNENLYKKLDTFGDVFQTIRSNYVTTINEEEVIEAAINGMLQSLDPHSSYMNLDNYKDMQEETNGKFGGLGIEVTMENGFVKIISPIDGTPGAKAGIQPGDYITHIDDESIFGLSLTEAVDQLRGLVGTTVKLKIARENEEEPLDISITRAIITVEAVKYRKEGNVGYIKLISFSEQADRGIKKAIKALTTEIGKDKIIGFVLDLRNNPGGLLGQSIEVTDNFLTSGEIVSTKGKDKSNIGSFKASRGDMTNGKPIIVLINRGSASASEIVAGALQDHKRAIIVGEQSYGKGSVQTIFPLNDRSAIRLTTALYYTPSGDSIHKIGITPDIEVTRSKKSDPADNTDNQLDYALDLLIKDSIIN
ncbi:MAG: S41 family peptidase [Candidatus Pelagibacterales bacterium]|jgi:carboxyl-terminal processing protease|tara:strand:- start:466 stop:1617 length:1152 start_codon:yes stop_codon:yes gene_type:complete